MFTCEFFTKSEFSNCFHGLLGSGDETGIAERLGVKPSTISKLFNPANAVGPLLYRAACIMAAWIAHTPGRGMLALRTFVNFVERARPNYDASPEGRILRLVDSVKPIVREMEEVANEIRRDEQRPLIRQLMAKVVEEHLAKKGKVA